MTRKRHSSIHKSIIYFTTLVVLVSGGCSTIFAVKPTPTTIPLINGEINTCLLISSTEVETTLGIKVARHNMPLGGLPTGCVYRSVTDDRVILQTLGFTDAGLKRADISITAVEWYEFNKAADLKMFEVLKVEDIENLGDQAYYKEGVFLDINVLKNKIYYQFITRTSTSTIEGIGYDALMKLTEIALQRMP